MSTREEPVQALVVRDQQQLAPAAPSSLSQTASTAAAAQAQAQIQARYMMAIQRPRDMDKARVKLLEECRRPRFAEVCRYRKPQGRQLNEQTNQWEDKYVEGPSIRFVEAALQRLGNLTQDQQVIYDDFEQRIIRVTVTDLENNVVSSQDVTVQKSVERSDGKGREVLGSRTNTRGRAVYLVRATDDELMTKAASLVSKAVRQCGLRLIPGDLIDEAMEVAAETRASEVKRDPQAARKRLVDGFAAIGVMPDALKDYVGHDLASCSPAELEQLRGVYQAIRDGETTWTGVMEAQRAERAEATKQTEGGEAKPGGTAGAAGLGLGKKSAAAPKEEPKKPESAG